MVLNNFYVSALVLKEMVAIVRQNLNTRNFAKLV